MAWIGSAPNQTTQRTDGTRTGAQVCQEQQVANLDIRADLMDTLTQDIANMVDETLKKDGGNQATANLQFGGYVAANHGDASARDHSANTGQIQDNAFSYATGAISSNDITASLSPAISAYAAGQLFLVKPDGANTDAVDININSVGDADVFKFGDEELDSGDLAADRMMLLAYDGTQFQMLNPPEFPSGTIIVINNSAAPAGWTKLTNQNDAALRIVSGTVSTGGTTNFSSIFDSRSISGSVGGTSLSVAQMPAHDHLTVSSTATNVGSSNVTNSTPISFNNSATNGSGYLLKAGTTANLGETSTTGSGASHTHSLSIDSFNMDVKYVDFIRIQKD